MTLEVFFPSEPPAICLSYKKPTPVLLMSLSIKRALLTEVLSSSSKNRWFQTTRKFQGQEEPKWFLDNLQAKERLQHTLIGSNTFGHVLHKSGGLDKGMGISAYIRTQN